MKEKIRLAAKNQADFFIEIERDEHVFIRCLQDSYSQSHPG